MRVGLLGLGGVGQAAARLCHTAAEALASHDLRLRVEAALVRDTARPREFAPADAAVLDNVEQFLAGNYELVIEATGVVEPAFDYVRRVLERGVPVVTANKSLVAARGEELFKIANRHGTALLCEAAVIAGMPFLTLLNHRPLAARVDRLAGIVNGTTNFVLSAMEQQRVSVEEAIRAAQELGFAEPDPTKDVEGIDAAEKLVIVLQHLGVRGVKLDNLEINGILGISVDDLVQARAMGGVIKLIASARFDADGVAAYVGPTFVPAGDPLASLSREQNGLRLEGTEIGRLLYSGPGAGPEVTAGTLLDDAVEVLTKGPTAMRRLAAADRTRPGSCRTPSTPWLLRLHFPGGAPVAEELSEFLASQGIWFKQTSDVRRGGEGDVAYVLTHACARDRVQMALSSLEESIGCASQAYRVLED